MKILEALGEPIANGGEEAFVAHLIEKIDTKGLEIDTFTPYRWYNKDYKALMESKGGRVFSLGLTCEPGKSRHNINKPFLRFLKTNHYDVRLPAGNGCICSASHLRRSSTLCRGSTVCRSACHCFRQGEHGDRFNRQCDIPAA